MKITVLRKLRTKTLARRNKTWREAEGEPNNAYNLYRKRLEGQVEALDRVLDDIDRLLKFHHDKWYDLRKT